MKKMRRLIVSIIMIVTSVALLSTASYAWFYMNRTVTASNMDVSVTTPGDLKIKYGHGDASNGGNSASGQTTKVLAPVSSISGIDGTFFFADPQKVGDGGSASGENSFIGYTESGLQNAYYFPSDVVGYIDYNFTLYNENKVDVQINTSMTFAHTPGTGFDGGDYSSAMRSTLFVENSSNGNVDVVAFSGAGSALPVKGITDVNATKANFEVKNVAFTIKKESNLKITLRVWVEGEDPVVTTTNFSKENIGTFNFNATFTIAP